MLGVAQAMYHLACSKASPTTDYQEPHKLWLQNRIMLSCRDELEDACYCTVLHLPALASK
ncbi:hypothetical protein PVK06_038607 [Gossypium arboreum]|uniref:Uncharacterized protein n=1 Tax=Gossypium arboreum TaxID=29729 RepID=A0ABR0N0K5_GOSAR|nr:hypothetical protein PVK06_038607 [Gossypium arboreum]